MFQIMHISERMNILKGGFLGKRMKGGAGIYEFARCIIMLIQKKKLTLEVGRVMDRTDILNTLRNARRVGVHILIVDVGIVCIRL